MYNKFQTFDETKYTIIATNEQPLFKGNLILVNYYLVLDINGNVEFMIVDDDNNDILERLTIDDLNFEYVKKYLVGQNWIINNIKVTTDDLKHYVNIALRSHKISKLTKL
jgi:hypothetical protein